MRGFRLVALLTITVAVIFAGLAAPGVALAAGVIVPRVFPRERIARPFNEFQRHSDPRASFRRNFRLINGVELPDSWESYATQDPAGFELAHQPLWFTRTYTDNSTTSLNFFDANLATADLGNASFPYQNSYLMKAMGVYIKNRIATDDSGAAGVFPSNIGDVQLLINTGVLQINVGKKDYGPFPLWRLAAGGGVWGGIAAAGAEAANLAHDWGNVGMPNPDSIYKLAIPFVIPAQTQAKFVMSWPAGAVDLTGNATICLILEGIEARPKQ